jgi:hypothetical protein
MSISTRRRGKKQREFFKKIKSERPHICYYCKKEIIEDSDLTIDHLMPSCKGGKSTESNLVISCSHCNNEKGDMTEEEYYIYLKNKHIANSAIHMNKIKIPYMYLKSPISEKKIANALNYYLQNDKFKKPIKCKYGKNNFRLIDGYSTYCVAKILKLDKVPVLCCS